MNVFIQEAVQVVSDSVAGLGTVSRSLSWEEDLP
jgi:hypothetical protein